jgi:small subunit ribosomal protein S18
LPPLSLHIIQPRRLTSHTLLYLFISPSPPSSNRSRVRGFDRFALAAAQRQAESASGALGGGASTTSSSLASLNLDADGGLRAQPEPGLPVDYCVFCYHGTKALRHDNTALLSKFVSERGSILPRRFTRACAKHQRMLTTTVRRARWMNFIPFHGKLHPRLRFTGMKPDVLREGATAGLAVGGGGGGGWGAGGGPQSVKA